jgi:hypothetical protein
MRLLLDCSPTDGTSDHRSGKREEIHPSARLIWRSGVSECSSPVFVLRTEGKATVVLVDEGPPREQAICLAVDGVSPSRAADGEVIFQTLLGRTGLSLLKLKLFEAAPTWLSRASALQAG